VSVDSPLRREGWQIARSNRAAVLDGRCGTTGGRIATSPLASTHGYHRDHGGFKCGQSASQLFGLAAAARVERCDDQYTFQAVLERNALRLTLDRRRASTTTSSSCLRELRSSAICADCSSINGSGGGDPALLNSLLTRIMLLLFVSRLRPR
jgi:hypothetical protein